MHEKKHLPRAVELEQRRFIGFNKQPVIDTSRVFVSDVKAVSNREVQRHDFGDERR